MSTGKDPNDKLDELLGGATPPPARDDARRAAMHAAMLAFDEVQAEQEAAAKKVAEPTQATHAGQRPRLRQQQPRRSSRFGRWWKEFSPMQQKQLMAGAAVAALATVIVPTVVQLQLQQKQSQQLLASERQTALTARMEAESIGKDRLNSMRSMPESVPGEIGSPFYESQLNEFNARESQRALESGKDFVPVLQGQLQIDNDLQAPLPAAPASSTEPARRNKADAKQLSTAQSLAGPQVPAGANSASKSQHDYSNYAVLGDGSIVPVSPSAPVEEKEARARQLAGMSAPVKDEAAAEPQYFGQDKFEEIKENPVKQTAVEPVSTFSIDTDTAAYSFIRRQLNNGVLPQKDAVRIEEMINYFPYDYALPDSAETPFQPSVTIYPSPWNPNAELLHIGIKGLDIAADEKPRSNLTFLLDTSGSMSSSDKLPLLQESMRMLLDQLDPDDTISIVVYAGSAGAVLEPTPVREKSKILAAVNNLQAGGSTAGGEGIRLAYDLAKQNFDKDAVNRVILGTDGDFNVGIYNPEELKGFVERERESGIFLSVLGFGEGNYNDAMMQTLAQNGNGIAAYIDTRNEARKVLVDEATSSLFTIAKDVKIQVEFNPSQVLEYRLIGYESRMLRREDFNNDKVDAGEVGSGHAVTAIYEIIPADMKQGVRIDELRYADAHKPAASAELAPNQSEIGAVAAIPPAHSDELGFLKIRYKLPNESTSRLITRPITKADVREMAETSDDVRFATAVAGFGELLRGGQYVDSGFTYDSVVELANDAKGKDEFGYRTEFVQMARQAKSAATLQHQPTGGFLQVTPNR
jgi:Ca-activated chloride channel homolog